MFVTRCQLVIRLQVLFFAPSPLIASSACIGSNYCWWKNKERIDSKQRHLNCLDDSEKQNAMVAVDACHNKSIRTMMPLKWTFWDILGQFGRLLDEFGGFRLVSYSFPTIFSHYRLIEKNA